MQQFSVKHRKNAGQKIDHLKFRPDFIEGLLLKYSVQHEVLSQHGDDSTVKRLTNPTSQGEYIPQKIHVNEQDGVWPAVSMTKEKRLFTNVRSLMLLCISKGVSVFIIQRRIV